VFREPSGERRQPRGLDAIDPSSALKGCVNQSSGFQSLEVLNDACARDRQATRKFAGGARHARKALKDDHANRVAE
jgi:hypothetical protein